MIQLAGLRLLTGTTGENRWSSCLDSLFEMGARLCRALRVDIHAGRLPAPCCLFGRIEDEVGTPHDLPRTLAVASTYSIDLHSPFEGVDVVAGGVWLGAALFNEARDDALLKLRFAAGADELPLHSHEYSDRVISVLDGAGMFRFRDQSGGTANPIENIEVKPGDVLVFPRNLVHTFVTKGASLTLLSYHSPFIPLDDLRQFTIAE